MSRSLLALLACLPFVAHAMGRKPAPEPDTAPQKTQEPAMSAPSQTEWSGQHAGYAAPKDLIIADAETWARVWKEGMGRPAPAVDFSRYFAAAVFVGAQPTGGYSATLHPLKTEGDRLVVEYSIAKPGKGAFVIQAFTQPFAIRLYEGDGRKALLRPKR
jgi:hypothetical protein